MIYNETADGRYFFYEGNKLIAYVVDDELTEVEPLTEEQVEEIKQKACI